MEDKSPEHPGKDFPDRSKKSRKHSKWEKPNGFLCGKPSRVMWKKIKLP